MNNLKRISTLLAVILVLSMALFAICSCGGDDTTDSSTPSSTPSSDNTTESKPSTEEPPQDNENLVTVTVVDQSGNGIAGAAVQICQGEQCFGKPIVTGSNGTGSREYTLNGDTLKAKIFEIEGMNDYLVPAELGYVYFSADSRTLTITVQEISLTVKDQSGKAVEGAKLQLAQGEHVFPDPLITDANGNASGYAAISGDNITVTVLDILSGNYEYPKSPVNLTGYSCNITVSQQLSYKVNIVDATGKGMSGIEVQLFDVANGYLQAKKTTDSNGAVVFEKMQAGEYYVTVSHPSPAYVITTETTDGKYYFASGEATLNLEGVELEELSYKVTVSNGLAGQTVAVYDENHKLVAESETNADGVATFTLKNGNYTAVLVSYDEAVVATPVVFSKYGTVIGTIKVIENTDEGTKDNPIYVLGSKDISVTANKTVYVAIPNAYRKSVNISCFGNLTVGYNGKTSEITFDNGFINISAVENAGETAIITLRSEEDVYASVYVNAPGTMDNPYNLEEMFEELNGAKLFCTVGNYETLYYRFVAKEDGVLRVTTATQYAYILINDTETNMYPMTAGEEITICISSMDLETYDSPVINAEIELGIGNVNVDYKVTVYRDGGILAGCTVKLYMYDENGGIINVATATTDANGVAVFTNIPYSAKYNVEADLSQMNGYEISNESTEMGAHTEYEMYLLHIKDGSREYPFEFNLLGTEEITLTANQIIYYTKNVNQSFDGTIFKIVANNEKVVMKAYYHGSDDQDHVAVSSVEDGNCVLVFPEGGIYLIEITSSENVDFEMEFTSEEPEAGSDFYNSYEIDAAGVYNETIEGTKYFMFTGMATSVKIVVNGEVNLCNVSDTGELTDAEGNTIEVETNGDWLYFAVTCTGSAECEIAITIE